MANGTGNGAPAWRSIVVGVAGAVIGAALVAAPGLLWSGGAGLARLEAVATEHGRRLDRVDKIIEDNLASRGERLVRLEAAVEEIRATVIRIERRLDQRSASVEGPWNAPAGR